MTVLDFWVRIVILSEDFLNSDTVWASTFFIHIKLTRPWLWRSHLMLSDDATDDSLSKKMRIH